MKTIVLDSILKSIQVTLLSAKVTNDCDVVTSWADKSTGLFTVGSTDSTTNGISPVIIVNPPAVSVLRIVKDISISNNDTGIVTAVIKFVNGVSVRQIAKVTLQIGDTWTLEGTFDDNGNIKYVIGAIAGVVFVDQSNPQTIGEPIHGSLTASELVATDTLKKLISLPIVTYPSLTELAFVKGLSSVIQPQINSKAPINNPSFTGTVTIPTPVNASDATTKLYVDGLLVGLIDDRGSYNASVNIFPSTGGSGTAGAILKGDLWYVSVAGTLGSSTVNTGDSFRALVDTPAQIAANWSILEGNIGYVPENIANKRTTFQAIPTDTAYASEKLVKDSLDAKQASGTYSTDIHSNIIALNAVTNINTGDQTLSGLGGEPVFAKNTGFNLPIGTTPGTVLEGRTFGTAANSASTDFAPATGGSYLPLAGGNMTGGITNSTSVNPLTTLAESWIGPSSTIGIYFKSGNVGIGTTGPGYKLDVNGATRIIGDVSDGSGRLLLGASNSTGAIFGQYNDGTALWTIRSYGGPIRFGTDNAELLQLYTNGITNPRLTIDTGGNVGVGYSTGIELTNNKLAVNGSGYFNGAVDATSYKIAGVSTFLDWTRIGYAGTAGMIPVSQGISTTPIWKTVNDAGIASIISPSFTTPNIGVAIGTSISVTGDIKNTTVGGGIYVKEGVNSTMGIATLVAGTVTINTTKVTTNSRIFLTTQTLGTILRPTAVGVTARTAGTSFTITSMDITDTSTVAWQIIEPS